MAEIVNLRQARKQRARMAKDQAAAENRRLHGRPKAEKHAERATRAKAAALLDGHHRDRSGGDRDD